MQTLGNDYIYLDNTAGMLSGPESLAVDLCDRHFSIGGDGIVLIERSTVADAKMRIFNRDGSEGGTAGNALRCVAKFLYDRGMVRRLRITVEAAGRIYNLRLILTEGKVSTVEVDMGKYSLAPASLPTTLKADGNGVVVAREIAVAGRTWLITCVSMGNPHAVTFGRPSRSAKPGGARSTVRACSLLPGPCKHGIRPCGQPPDAENAGLGARQRRDVGLRHRRLRGCSRSRRLRLLRRRLRHHCQAARRRPDRPCPINRRGPADRQRGTGV